MENMTNKFKQIGKNIQNWFIHLSKKGKVLLIAVGVVIILLALFILAQRSTPGDFLYGLKVYVLENVGSVTRVTDQQQFDYGISLLEERLEEVKQMSRNEKLTEKQLETFDAQFEAQVQKIDELLNSEDAPFNAREIFNTTNHLVAIVEAAQQIMDASTESGSTDRFADIDDKAESIHEAQIQRIVAESSPEEIIALIQEDIAAISTVAPQQNGYTQQRIKDWLIDTSDALSVGDFAKALRYVSRAAQLLETQAQVGSTQG